MYTGDHTDIPNDNICFTLLEDWTSSNDLLDLAQGLLYLLYYPVLDDSLSGYFINEDSQLNEAVFLKNVQDSLEGRLTCEDFTFPVNKHYASRKCGRGAEDTLSNKHSVNVVNLVDVFTNVAIVSTVTTTTVKSDVTVMGAQDGDVT